MTDENVAPEVTPDKEVNGDGKAKRAGPKKEEKPIEELYDLSKPIPKVRYVWNIIIHNAIQCCAFVHNMDNHTVNDSENTYTCV